MRLTDLTLKTPRYILAGFIGQQIIIDYNKMPRHSWPSHFVRRTPQNRICSGRIVAVDASRSYITFIVRFDKKIMADAIYGVSNFINNEFAAIEPHNNYVADTYFYNSLNMIIPQNTGMYYEMGSGLYHSISKEAIIKCPIIETMMII